MKLMLGLRGNRSLLSKGKVVKQSTKYSLRGRVEGNLEDKLRYLRNSINTEITIASPYLLTLEDLGDRYYEDGQCALHDEEFGYYRVYVEGYEQTRIISDHCYRCLPSPI